MTFQPQYRHSQYFGDNFAIQIAVLIIETPLVVVIITYLFTICRFKIQLRNNQRRQRKTPASLPYFVPWIGNGFQFACYPHALYESARSTSIGNSIVKARLGPAHMYIINGAEYVKAAFGSSKNLTFDSRAIQIMEQVYRLPASDAAPFKNSPTKAKELVAKLDHTYNASLANRQCTAAMVSQFIKVLDAQIETLQNGEETQVPIGQCMRRLMTTASVSALFGDRILRENPDFVQNYWLFSRYFKRLLYGMPKAFCRKGIRGRDNMLRAVKDFIESTLENDVSETGEKPSAQEDVSLFSRVAQDINKLFMEAGFSVDGRASVELGLVFAINDNAIPTTIWMLLEILKSPDLHERIYKEIQGALGPDDKLNGGRRLDIGKLQSLPLLNSLYSECLRYLLSAQLVRQLKNDVEIDGYMLKSGNLVVAPTLTAHRDPDIWSRPDHPPNEIWPERFLHVRDVKSSNFFPYGTGAIGCPGRVYAKTAILASTATMLLNFDFEVMGFVDENGKPCHGDPTPVGQGMGVGLPDRELLVKMTRRAHCIK